MRTLVFVPVALVWLTGCTEVVLPEIREATLSFYDGHTTLFPDVEGQLWTRQEVQGVPLPLGVPVESTRVHADLTGLAELGEDLAYGVWVKSSEGRHFAGFLEVGIDSWYLDKVLRPPVQAFQVAVTIEPRSEPLGLFPVVVNGAENPRGVSGFLHAHAKIHVTQNATGWTARVTARDLGLHMCTSDDRDECEAGARSFQYCLWHQVTAMPEPPARRNTCWEDPAGGTHTVQGPGVFHKLRIFTTLETHGHEAPRTPSHLRPFDVVVTPREADYALERAVGPLAAS